MRGSLSSRTSGRRKKGETSGETCQRLLVNLEYPGLRPPGLLNLLLDLVDKGLLQGAQLHETSIRSFSCLV
jgi:hypothetical protein